MAVFLGDKFHGFASFGMLGATILVGILVVWSLTSDFLFYPDWLYNIWYNEDISILLPIILIIILIFWVTSEGKKTNLDSIGNKISGWLGGRS